MMLDKTQNRPLVRGAMTDIGLNNLRNNAFRAQVMEIARHVMRILASLALRGHCLMILVSVRLAIRSCHIAICALWTMSVESQCAQNAMTTSLPCKMDNVPFVRTTGHLTIDLTRLSVNVLIQSLIRCSLTSKITTSAVLATS